MDFALKGKAALVTGAARGIGKAEALALGLEGASIAINDLDAEAAAQCVAELEALGIRAFTAIGDVSEPTSAERVVGGAARALGGLHILINNAGIAGKHVGQPAYDTETADWDLVVQVHLRSTFLCSKHALPFMREASFGRIVNTSSIMFTGGGRIGASSYAAAKAGIVGFTRTYAKEVGPFGVTVNAIAPGYVDTELLSHFTPEKRAVINDQNPLGRFCRPEEVGALVAFLCSAQAAYINGATIGIDGGKRDYHWGGV